MHSGSRDRHMDELVLALFDIDGTLLHSGGCGRAATRLALAEVFGTIGALDHISFAGKTDWQILHDALEPAGFSREAIKSRLSAYNETVSRHLAHIIGEFPVAPCPGAPELIAALRAHPQVVLGLVTGNMQALAPIKLRTAGYDPADFTVGAYGSEGWERAMLPPLALERARTLTGHDFAPGHVVIIGDTPNDIACAASIGARTIAVGTGPYTTMQLQLYGPDHLFDTMHDHQRVLDAILSNHTPG